MTAHANRLAVNGGNPAVSILVVPGQPGLIPSVTFVTPRHMIRAYVSAVRGGGHTKSDRSSDVGDGILLGSRLDTGQ